MRDFRKILRLAITPQLIAVFALVSPPAHARLMSDQCDISSNASNTKDSPACSVSYSSTQAILFTGQGGQLIDSVRTSPGTAAAPIDAWYYCRYVDNNSTDKSLFVPFKSSLEWTSFITAANAPKNTLNISLTLCARPGSVSVPDNYPTNADGTPNPFFKPTSSVCSTAQTQSVAVPIYARYVPAGPVTYTAPAVTFTCTSAYGPWVETATPTFSAGASADGQTVAQQQTSGGWTLSNVIYTGSPPPAKVTSGGGSSSGGGGGCFVAGSRVLMEDGRLKPIETLYFGDRVRNAQGGINMVLERVVCALPKDSDLYGFNGGKPMVTAYHPFVVTEGFAAVDPEGLRNKYPYFEDEIGSVSRLQAGITLLSPDGPRRIQSVEKHTTTEEGTAYDLALDGDQTFFVEGFAARSQHDNAHAVRYMPYVQMDKVSVRRATAVASVFASLGIAMSPLAALAGGGSSPSTSSSSE